MSTLYRIPFLIIFFLFSSLSAVAAEESFREVRALGSLTELRVEARNFREKKPTTSREIAVPSKDGEQILLLEPHDIRSPNYLSQLTDDSGTRVDRTRVDLFKGSVQSGKSSDFARLALISDPETGKEVVRGFFRSGERYYNIEPRGSQLVEVSELSAEELQYLVSACAISHTSGGLPVAPLSFEGDGGDAQNAGAPLQFAEIATEADFEFVQSLGGSVGSANSSILSVLNSVDAIYQQQLGIAFVVTFQHGWATNQDPYTTSNPDIFLDQFTAYWESQFRPTQIYDVAHLWTAKFLDGDIAGIAFLGSACSNESYGISQVIGGSQFAVPLAAHEIAHNFDALHDNCSGGQQFIMCPNLVPGASVFSPLSLSDMESYIASISCLSTDAGGGGENQPPVFQPVADKVVLEGENLAFTVAASDPNGDPLSIVADSLPFGASFDGATFLYTPLVGTVIEGNSSLDLFASFVAVDPEGLSDQLTVRITVVNSNRVPTLLDPPVQSAKEGELFTFQFQAADPDNDSLEFFAPKGLPAGASLDAATGFFSWVPSGEQAGNYNIDIAVSDALGAIASIIFGVVVDDITGVQSNPSSYVASDFSGSGRAELLVFRPSLGAWFTDKFSPQTQKTAFTFVQNQWGLPGDVPMLGDYNGDNVTDRAVFRPQEANWYIQNSGSGSVSVVSFGLLGDLPSAADFDGDGRTDVGIFRADDGLFIYLSSADGKTHVVQSIGAIGDLPVPCDYDGDGRAERAVYRPSTAQWLVADSAGNVNTFSLGLEGDLPVPADYDGDGDCERAVWRPSSGEWFFDGLPSVQLGLAGDVPVATDFEGDGKANPSVWRPAGGMWFVRDAGGRTLSQQLGLATDTVPLAEPLYYALRNTNKLTVQAASNRLASVDVFRDASNQFAAVGAFSIQTTTIDANADDTILRGDYNGDRIDDVAVFRNGEWRISLIDFFGQVSGQILRLWGIEGDLPVSGDFDGDGVVDIGVFRPVSETGFSQWLILLSQSGQARIYNWGIFGDLPLPADFNGDGIDDPSVWRPSTGVWHTLDGRTGVELSATQWGLAGDIPRVADFDRDGRADRAIWRPADGNWFVLLSGGGLRVISWGLAGDVPVPGTYASSSSVDFAVYRPSVRMLFVLSQNGAQRFATAPFAGSVVGAR